MSPKIAVLVLAAGNSSRFGGCKLLANYQGRALLSYALTAAKSIAEDHVYLLTGAWHNELLQAAENSPWLSDVHFIRNESWQQGMGGSIAKGVSEIAENYDAIMIMLADQPLIALSDYQYILQQLKLGSSSLLDISCASYGGKYGVPAIFSQRCFEQLMQLSGEQGAKELLYDTRYKKVQYILPSAADDIDYAADLNRLNQSN